MAKSAASTSTSPSAPPTSAPKDQYWEELTSAYGLDSMETDDATAGPAEQTVLQEYHAYVKALLSAKGTDIIKFWVVSDSCILGSHYLWLSYR